MKNIRLLLLLLICIITTTARADFNDGVVAYLMADYEKAFKTMQSLAETSDHGYAQYYMGMMYLKGQGVEQDYKAASNWFRKASEKKYTASTMQVRRFIFQRKRCAKGL